MRTFQFIFLAGNVFLWSFSLSAQTESPIQEATYEKSVIQLTVVQQEYDYVNPWKKTQMSRGSGSGFVIAGNRILTNAHNVSNYRYIEVKKQNVAKRYPAKVDFVGHDCDLAIVSVYDPAFYNDMAPLEFGPLPKVNSTVQTCGFPLGGQTVSVTKGVVSRIEVGIYSHTQADTHLLVQTDAAINPGNSGGPLIDLEGKVVGINTAIYSRNGGGHIGIGFAIPVNMAKAVYTQLIEHGNVTRGYLGVTIQDLTADLALSFGIKDTKGVLVSQVLSDSPAEKAGMRQGDVIVSLNGKPVDTAAALRNEIAMTAPGTSLKVGVIRDGKTKTLSVKVEKMSEDKLTASRSESMKDLGMNVSALTDELAKQYGHEGESGVLVTGVEPGSIAARAGIRPGVLIKEANRRPVKNIKEFEAALKQSGKKPILLFVKDGRGSHYIALDTGK